MKTFQRRFALIRRFVLGVLLLVPLVFAQGTQPQAAIVQLDGSGLPTGIRDLQVGSVFIHITFVEGTQNAVFPGGETFNTTFASNIVDEIVLVLNALGSPAPQLSQIFADPREFNVPIFAFDANRFRGGCKGSGSSPIECDTPGWLNLGSPSSIVKGFSGTWAVPSPVPLPAALPLFGSALAMLGIVGWRRRRQSGA